MADFRLTANIFTYNENSDEVLEALQTEVVLSLAPGSGDTFTYEVLFKPGIALPFVTTSLNYAALAIPELSRTYDVAPDFEVFGDIVYEDDSRVTILGFSYQGQDVDPAVITEITMCIDGDLRPIDLESDFAARGRGDFSPSPFAPGDVIDLSAAIADHGGTGTDTLPATPDIEGVIIGTEGADRLEGTAGDDSIRALDGPDTVIAGAGNDSIAGGASDQDRADVIYGGAGNDTIDGGYGNDQLRGDAGNDVLSGGFGADTVIGGTGDDRLTSGALGDLLFGGDGDDFLNGGFGYDRMSGGAGADEFFHLGVFNHASDWVQDYSAAEGDTLVFGRAGATAAQFQVNIATTAGAGEAGVDEAFVIYRPTGQIVWALVDGAGEDSITLVLEGQSFDLTF